MIASIPPPVLEVYYAPDCAPCRLELPLLAGLERNGTHLRIVVVSEENKARQALRAASPRLDEVAVSPPRSNARAVLREAGDADGMVPYARIVAPTGTTCAQWRGLLTRARIRGLFDSCARAVIARHSRRS